MNAEVRAKIYWFLSDFCLNAPSRVRLCSLLTHLKTAAEQSGDEWVNILIKETEQALSIESGNDNLLNALGLDYIRLFGGLRKGYGATPPFETLWRSDIEMTDLLGQLADIYSQAGLPTLPDVDTAPDNLGAELRFVGILCQQEALTIKDEEQESYRLLQYRFLKSHLLVWLPNYINEALSKSGTLYYQTVLGLLAEVLQEDFANLTKQLQPVEF